MKNSQKWSRWFPVLACLFVVLLVAGLLQYSVYRGQFEAWEEALGRALPLDGPIRSFPTNTVESILEGGPQAVRYLLDRIEGTLLERIATRFSGQLPILKRFAHVPDLSTQNSIPIIITKMEESADAHLPRMRRIFLSSPSSHLNLLNAMGQIGRDDPETIRFLTRVGLDPKMPVYVRGNCAFYLGMQSPSEEIVEALKGFYSDPAADVQQYACASLGKHGRAARSAVPLLVSALTNANSEVRNSAGRSLAQIETNAAVLKSLLLPMAGDTNTVYPPEEISK